MEKYVKVKKEVVYAGINEAFKLGIIQVSSSVESASSVYDKVEAILGRAFEKDREINCEGKK